MFSIFFFIVSVLGVCMSVVEFSNGDTLYGVWFLISSLLCATGMGMFVEIVEEDEE